MRFQARLTGVPGLERPEQTFAMTVGECELWAKTTIKKHRKWATASVDIEEMRPVVVKRITWADVTEARTA